jgi:hypothetical protein
MASTTRSLSDLEKLCKKAGIWPTNPTGRGGKFAKRDFIKELQKYHLIQRFGSLEKVPNLLKYRLSYESPQLAYQYTNLKPAECEEIWNSSEWGLTEKENGIRGFLVYLPEEGLELYSRNLSVEDFLPVPYGHKLLYTIKPGECKTPFCIDVEVKSTNKNLKTFLRDAKGVETETELQAIAALLALNEVDSKEVQRTQEINNEPVIEYKMIDILFHQGDLRVRPYGERKSHTEEIVKLTRSHGLNVKKIRFCGGTAEEKKSFHQGILDSGGEGTVAANLKMHYVASENRNKKSWVKIKRSVSESLSMDGMGDSIDGFVTGFEMATEGKAWEGLIGALKISVFLQKENGEEELHQIATVTNIPLSKRKEISIKNADGTTSLDPKMYDRVVEVNGQAISARARRLTHPRIERWRDDKSKYDCVLSEEFLNSQIL